MIRWILKGIMRDKTRSLFPFIVVTVGVTLLIFLLGFMEGVFGGMLEITAKLDTGQLRFVNKPFYDEEHLVPLDRSLAAQNKTLQWLEKNGDPRIEWSPRIRWGAIMDVPDEKGETRSQTPPRTRAVGPGTIAGRRSDPFAADGNAGRVQIGRSSRIETG